ncbi:hypothetical protein QF038_003949 [Pseudarthrobacter sp. W1I19]|uniref:hypothetical protein n=1 Tax=Pseudarthrobacter sp. W1I19 TaxID=3042288 RepID=UPI0027822627|nr:hypothetical protein [Pseudarthrobacter sp. W1I19]MDQ0925441.1 hypothetical protein [Pseudarthrobacter sp. W1I19]
MSQDRAFSVFTDLPAYTAAVAELPVSAALAENVRGAVAVVPGTGDWWQGMLAARAGGAAAVVLADPAVLPRGTVESEQWPGDIPVILERPRLRPDVVADAVAARRGSPARIITVECAAPAAGLGALICDGFGWMRSLAGGAVALHASIATVHSRIALLDVGEYQGGAVPATLSATSIGGLHAGGLLQVLALGEVRTEVTVDQPAGLVRVETATEEGTLHAPARYESSARLALRRAIDASLAQGPATDLAELLQDMALARALLDA